MRRTDGAFCCEQTAARLSLTDALRGLWTAPPVYPLRLRRSLVTRRELHDALTRGRRLNVLLPVVAVLIGVGLLKNTLSKQQIENVAAYVTTKIAK